MFSKIECSNATSPLEIIRYNSQGEGVALIDGKITFVPYTAVGDKIIPKQIECFSHYNRVPDYKLLQSSPLRVKPPCPHFTHCGGCDFQHLPYTEELKIKEEIVKNAFLKISRLNTIPLLPIQPSPNEWNYRNSAQFHRQKGEVGFYQSKTHQLIPITQCLLLEKKIEKLPGELKERGLLPEVPLFTLFTTEKGYQITSNRNAHSENQFAQVNGKINELIQKQILTWVKKLPQRERLLELFCGSGNLSLPLAPYFQKIVGIDYSAANIKQANQKKKAQALFHCSYQKGDCHHKLKGIKAPFDCALIDPPRSGVKNLHQIVLDYKIKTLFYLSCNPITLARDLAPLLKEDFKLEAIKPFDMFPKSRHVEVLALVTKF